LEDKYYFSNFYALAFTVNLECFLHFSAFRGIGMIVKLPACQSDAAFLVSRFSYSILFGKFTSLLKVKLYLFAIKDGKQLVTNPGPTEAFNLMHGVVLEQ